MACAKHILATTSEQSWYSYVSIDPCASLLPKTAGRLEEQKIAAMGKNKWMSPKSARKGPNLRAPATAKTQNATVTRVEWTPVFARGKVFIYVCDAAAAEKDASLPAKLNDTSNLGKFVANVLPGILADMQKQHGWSSIPRAVVHDKASYMVTHAHQRLHATFASSLKRGGLQSWLGDGGPTTTWLAAKWGDVYVHETLIARIRRLLDAEFACDRLNETPAQFKARVKKAEAHLNSANFFHEGKEGLRGLAKGLRARCRRVVKLKGERIPK